MRLIWVVIPLVLIGVIGTIVLVETTKDFEIPNKSKLSSGPSVSFFTDKEIYEVGEFVIITMENTGGEILGGRTTPCGFVINDEDGNQVASFWGVYLAECRFNPDEKILKTWSAKSDSDPPVRPGIYTLVADLSDNVGQRFIFDKQIQMIDPNNAFELLDSPPSSENIQMLKDSKLVFSGRLESKIQLAASESKNLEFEILENFRGVKENTVTVYTHEGSWKKCAGLEEGLEYLIFVSPKYGAMTCYHAISLPNDLTDELREFSSNIPWW